MRADGLMRLFQAMPTMLRALAVPARESARGRFGIRRAQSTISSLAVSSGTHALISCSRTARICAHPPLRASGPPGDISETCTHTPRRTAPPGAALLSILSVTASNEGCQCCHQASAVAGEACVGLPHQSDAIKRCGQSRRCRACRRCLDRRQAGHVPQISCDSWRCTRTNEVRSHLISPGRWGLLCNSLNPSRLVGQRRRRPIDEAVIWQPTRDLAEMRL